MKVQCIYSSLTGCTKRLAEGIVKGLDPKHQTELIDLKEVDKHTLDGDVLLLGYWVDKGGPNKPMLAFMETLEGRTVGLFCTLAYFVDSKHGRGAIEKGVAAVEEKNLILGSFAANGKLDPRIIEMFRKRPMNESHSASPANEIRWKIMDQHPSAKEIAHAAERFDERLQVLEALQEKGLEYRSLN